MKISAVICAAGKGERAGFDKNKLLVPFHGANALYYCVKKILSFAEGLKGGDCLCEVIVCASTEDFKEISAICLPLGCKVVIGGATRTESVYNALKSTCGDMILIHDGARPFVTKEQCAQVLECAKSHSAAVLAMPVTDTITVQRDGYMGDIPERKSLYAIQTPQVFDAKKLKYAYERAIAEGETFTDDGSLYSRYVSPVKICAEGSAANKKLTYREDFLCGEYDLIAKLGNAGARTGFGVDVHAFGEKASHIKLCGVEIPCARKLVAHSDGDVALHALMDALLSAAGLDDIGHYFPDSDSSLSGADSGELLKRVLEMLAQKGLKPLCIALAIQAEEPRLARHIDKMKDSLAALTGAAEENISITAGTCEGLGFVGERLGIAAYCACSLT